jgi:Tfp pilus assembly PilM family ATPase
MANWFGSKTDPIGVDLGRSSLKLAQVAKESSGQRARLVAAATIEVPAALRASTAGPQELLREAVAPALAANGFKGRRVVLGMPASWMHIDRVRLAPGLTPEQMKQTVAWESIDRLPFHPSRAMLRHVVAGDVFESDGPRKEVIVLAARNEITESMLEAARRAKLDVIGLVPEPLALVGGFASSAAPGGGDAGVRAVVDVGYGATRLYIAQGGRMQFARIIGIGWSHLAGGCAGSCTGAGGAAADVGSNRSWVENGSVATATVEPAVSAAPETQSAPLAPEPVRRLVSELSTSRHYHEQTFPATPIGEVVVVGGAATNRRLRAQISAVLDLPVRCGDPLSPFGPAAAGSSSGLASRPEWAAAIGLSLSHAA